MINPPLSPRLYHCLVGDPATFPVASDSPGLFISRESDTMSEKIFPDHPSIVLFDPLAQLLGAGDGTFRYTFDDAVKLAGHACPTVAGAYVMTLRALSTLYGMESPVRGEIRIRVAGEVDQGVTGPIGQIFTLITGAAADNGFQGLAGRHARKGLLGFGGDPAKGHRFQRGDTGPALFVRYDPSPIPPHDDLQPLMQRVLSGQPAKADRRRFAALWRERVVAIVEDGGERTVILQREGGGEGADLRSRP